MHIHNVSQRAQLPDSFERPAALDPALECYECREPNAKEDEILDTRLE